MMTFDQLGVIDPILRAIDDLNYQNPTPIQARAIPHVLERNDLLATAQTGTGKTAAFAIPIIQLIEQIDLKKHRPVKLRALILTPTRELAIQIDESIAAYSKYTNLRHTVIFGGVKQGAQVKALKKSVHVLVATPGRLLDLIGQGFVHLADLQMFVLDEADRMLDMGFIHDVRKLIKLLPRKKQSLFFSATMPQSIVKLSNQILTKPKKVSVDPVSSAADTVNQFLFYTNRKTKKDLLLHLLKVYQIDQALVFTRTKHGADRVARDLKRKKIKAAAIHGDKAQNYRQKVLKQFKERSLKVLVASDIAARGIDVESLRFVINYDVPNQPETYVHRIGRSGRAGKSGMAFSICEPEENAYIKSIEKLIKRPIEVVTLHPFPQTDRPMTIAEKKEWNKVKQQRRQDFFRNRKKRKARS